MKSGFYFILMIIFTVTLSAQINSDDLNETINFVMSNLILQIFLAVVVLILLIAILIMFLNKSKTKKRINKANKKQKTLEKRIEIEKKSKNEIQLNSIEWKKKFKKIKDDYTAISKIKNNVMENLHPQIWEVALDGKIIDCNYMDYYGINYERQNVIGKSLDELFKASSYNLIHKFRQIVNQAYPEKGFIDSFIHNDVTHWKKIDWIPLYDEENKMVSVLVVIYDISAVIENKDIIDHIQEITDNGIIITQNSEIVFFNPKVLDISGYSENEMKKMPVLTLISERNKKEIKSYQTEKGHKFKLYETSFKHKNGQSIKIHVSYSQIQYNMKPANLLLINDISEVQRIQESLKKIIKMLKVAIESSDIGMFIKNNENDIIGNKEFLKLWKIKNKTMRKNSWKPLISEMKKSLNDKIVNKYFVDIINDYERKIDTEITFKDKKVIELSSFPFKDDLTEGRIWLCRDITESKNKELKLKRAKEDAEYASSSKTEFLANMSHEIRTPMNGILGVAALLEKTQLDQQQKRYVDIINVSANSLLDLVNDILDISKIEAGYLKLENIKFDLFETVSSVVDLLALKARDKKVEIHSRISPEIPQYVVGDPTRLRQIIINLGNNAIKFTEEGSITIYVKIQRREKDHVLLQFTVSDTGIGIKEERIDTIFDSYQQEDISTTRKFGGTGLGLAISKKLSEMMGGDIWVESEFGKGSDFHFTANFEMRKDKFSEKVKQICRENKINVALLSKNEKTIQSVSDIFQYFHVSSKIIKDDTEIINELLTAEKAKIPYDVLFIDIQDIDFKKILHHKTAYKELDKLKVAILVSFKDSSELELSGDLKNIKILNKPVKRNEFMKSILQLKGIEFEFEEDKKEETPIDIKGSDRKIKTMLAEDNIVNQGIIEELMENQGLDVTTVENGQQAIDLHNKRNFDLIFMDVNMPVLDGLEATRKIRMSEDKQKRKIPVVALTADIRDEDKKKCLEAGMDDFLIKPVNLKSLKKVVNRVMTKEHKVTSAKSQSNKKTDEKINIDMGYIHETLGDNTTVIKKTFDLILNRFPTSMRDIRESIKEADGEKLHRSAHGMKGFINYFNLEDIKKKVLDLEKMGKKNNIQEAKRIMIDLEPKLKCFIKSLKEVAKTL